jgi:hypothetical protein
MTKREALELARRTIVALINDYMDGCDEEMEPEDRAKLYAAMAEIRDRLQR